MAINRSTLGELYYNLQAFMQSMGAEIKHEIKVNEFMIKGEKVFAHAPDDMFMSSIVVNIPQNVTR